MSDETFSATAAAPVQSGSAEEQQEVLRISSASHSGHRVLVAVEAGQDNESLVLFTRRLAESLKAPWIVLYVDTSQGASAKEDSSVSQDIELAKELGGEGITTSGDDAVAAVLRVASSRNITQIVFGKNSFSPWWRTFRRRLAIWRLVLGGENIGVHIVPQKGQPPLRPQRQPFPGSGWRQYLAVVGTVAAVAVAGFLFNPQVGTHAMAFLSLLAVVVLALFVDRGPALLAAALTAGIWDYFFVEPLYHFRVSHFDDILLLVMFFVVALALGQLTARIRGQEIAERQRENRATALYLLGRELAEAATTGQICAKVTDQLGSSLGADVAILLPDPQGQLQAQAGGTFVLGDGERKTAESVMSHSGRAGRTVSDPPAPEDLFIPLRINDRTLGVVGLRLRQQGSQTIHHRNLAEALARQIALALDRQRLSEFSEKAKLLAESERLGKTLLDTMSHEIRTPLAAIKSAASRLGEISSSEPPNKVMLAEIQEATDRLNRLVGKVLDITRIESGHIQPKLNECDVAEVVNLAVAETEKELAQHTLNIDMPAGLPIVEMDFVFLQQALMNLLSNAAHHTPAGTTVELSVAAENNDLILSVADHGPGLSTQSLDRVFEKFYRGPGAPTGGVGLGLSLVKGLMEAMGGGVETRNRPSGGAVFTLRLPIRSSSCPAV